MLLLVTPDPERKDPIQKTDGRIGEAAAIRVSDDHSITEDRRQRLYRAIARGNAMADAESAADIRRRGR